MPSIYICICTCLRGELLKVCLDSVAQVRVEGADLSVLVVDNDPDASAQPLIEQMQSDFPLPLFYANEPKRGIPCARNRVIDEVQSRQGDFLVFIDDDEWVEPGWLQALWDLSAEHQHQVIVSGGVIAELPDETPQDIAALFNTKLPKQKRGQSLETCATNNVIVPMALIADLGLRFDESNPLAGGTDTIFFKQATNQGATILKCPEALVHELIPESRTQIRWLAKRKFRAGETEAWRKQQNGRSKTGIVASASAQVLIGSVKTLVQGAVGQKISRNKSWLKVCRSAGVVKGVFAGPTDSYQNIDSAL